MPPILTSAQCVRHDLLVVTIKLACGAYLKTITNINRPWHVMFQTGRNMNIATSSNNRGHFSYLLVNS
uniref:Uncharacterized protein n=1 Tax=Arundo donax TaxID=35708 RepID=A0A0A8YMQ3_ARUDO